MIYLDNAATTKPSTEVLDAMKLYNSYEYGNPNTNYALGKRAKAALETARSQVSDFVHCPNDTYNRIIFTSGGTEANNLAILGTRLCLQKEREKTHILISPVEHDSVINSALALKELGFEVEFLNAEKDGTVTSFEVMTHIKPNTGLVSVQYVNNEVGAVNNITEIANVCKKRDVLFHTDCVQAAGTFPLDVRQIGCDMLTISSHKIHGCKGAGALYVKDYRTLDPLIYGGAEQEYGLRGGTQNVPAFVGFGKACELAGENLKQNADKVSGFKQIFYKHFLANLKEKGYENVVKVNGAPVVSKGKILNLQLKNIDAQSFITLADTQGVYVSAGSACRSNEQKPSRVLTAMGLSKEQAASSIRLSFGTENNVPEVIEAAQILAECADTLYSLKNS